MPADAPIDPARVSSWPEADVLEALDRWTAAIPARRLVEVPSIPHQEALIVGDTHADWPTSEYLAARFLLGAEPKARWVALGDYVDRTPPELPLGSLRNALYLLSLRAALPDRVLLLRGNHETQRRISGGMHALRDEAEELWGGPGVADRIEDLFDRLPLAARTESGAYLAHAGFPLDTNREWRAALEDDSDQLLLQVVWNDVEGSPACGHRGIEQTPIRRDNLEAFLDRSDTSVFLRGHDPDIAGRFLFDGRLLTVHSTRVFGWAGLTVATIPLGERMRRLEPRSLLRLSFPQIPGARRG